MAVKLKTAITRFRTQREYAQVKKAAKLSQLSLNEFVRRATVEAANRVTTTTEPGSELGSIPQR